MYINIKVVLQDSIHIYISNKPIFIDIYALKNCYGSDNALAQMCHRNFDCT